MAGDQDWAGHYWDTARPRSLADVVDLLRRRIEVHRAWRDAIRAGSSRHLEASQLGAGTEASHETYIRQYQAAIEVLTRRTEY